MYCSCIFFTPLTFLDMSSALWWSMCITWTIHLPCFPVGKKNCPRVITVKLLLFIKPFQLLSIIADISLSPPQIYIYCTLFSNIEKHPVNLDCLPHKQVFISLKLTLYLAMATILPHWNSPAIDFDVPSSSLGDHATNNS